MATYEDTVLALNPVHFWRLDELVGPTMVDTAVGGTDGVYFPEADYGRPSPIETDPASKAIGKRVGRAVATAPANNWSYGGWLFTNDSFDTYLICRSGNLGNSGGNFIVWDSGGSRIRFHVAFDSAVAELSFTAVPNTWYYVLGTRNGAVVTLIVNDVIVDQDTTTFSTAPMDDGWVDGGQFFADSSWKIGAGGDGGNLGNLGDAIDEPMVFDYSLTLAQSTEIYEAALNLLLLHGRSDVIPTGVLRSDIEPAPTSFPFRHNWSDPLIERISFRTAISTGRTGAEDANGQRPKPRREFEFIQILKNHTERRKLRAQLWANQTAKWMVPVRQDGEWLTGTIAAGSTNVPVATSYKEYEVGGYLGIRQLNDAGVVTHWEEALITAVNVDSVDCEALTYDYSGSILAYPVRRAYMPSSVQVTGHTDSVEELTLTARLLPEDEPQVPNRVTPWTPTIEYRGYEVFDPSVWQSNDWTDTRDYDVDRVIDDVDFDIGLISPQSDTAGAAEAFSYRMLLKGRAEISAFLGWFYHRAGKLKYLWVPTMQSDFELVSLVNFDLTVEGTNYSDNYALAEARQDIAFVYHDNSMVLRRVVGFSGSPDETLELDETVPTITNLRSISLLKFCRLDGDQVELAWVTDDVAQISWRFRELVHSPRGRGRSSQSPSHSSSPSQSPSHSASPSPSTSASVSPSGSASPSVSLSFSASVSPSHSQSPSSSASPSTAGAPAAAFHRDCPAGYMLDDSDVCQPMETVLGAQGGTVYWVAKTGSDSNPGTEAQPFLTISKAADVMQPDDAVIVRAGIYREQIVVPRGGTATNHRISYAAYTGEEVIVSGADVVTGWSVSGNAYFHSYTTSLPANEATLGNKYRREMVIVDGTLLTAVYTRAEVIPGTFFVEGTSTAPTGIYIRLAGDANPSGHTVEVAKRPQLFFPALGLGYFRLLGFKFQYAPTEFSEEAAVKGGSTGGLIEENTVEWCSSIGMTMSGSSMTYRGNEASDCGQLGLSGTNNNSLMEYNKTFRNNWKHFNISGEAGAMKFVLCNGSTMRYHESADNYGNGIWFDINNTNNIIENCLSYNNLQSNLFLEANHVGGNIVRNNVLFGATIASGIGGAGIILARSPNNTIVNNTIFGNEGMGIWIENNRTGEWLANGAEGYQKIYNNILVDNNLEIRFDAENQTDARTTTFDGNLYWNAAGILFRVKLPASTPVNTRSLATWQAYINGDANAVVADPLLADVNSYTGWHLTSPSPARGMGVTPPVAVATDYDGDSRPGTGADVGADQFTAPTPSPSHSLSPSSSVSISPSHSTSPSHSPSASQSHSQSPSLSPSHSLSQSPSGSVSPSVSPSSSGSPSVSPSSSGSPSGSQSPSSSASPSPSSSVSPSHSQSPSASTSPSSSVSPSHSTSPSSSASPSSGGGPPMTNLKVWLDASQESVLSDGAVQATLTDFSGNGNNYSNSIGASNAAYWNNQQNGLPGVVFGSGQGMVSSFALSAIPYTIYAVYKTFSVGGNHRTINGSNNWLIGQYGGFHQNYSGAFAQGPAAVSGTAVAAWVVGTAGPTNSFVVNNSAIGTGSTTVPGTVGLGIAGAFAEGADAYILEILIYDVAHNSTEQGNVWTYLQAKWGL